MPPPPIVTPVPHNVVAPNVSQTSILELNGNNLGSQQIHAPKDKQPPLSDTLANTSKDEWSFSKNGGGGAVLVRPKDTTMTGSAIKVEQAGACKAAQKCSQMMEGFFAHAQGPQPFVAPRITVLTGEELRKQPDLLKQINDTHSEAFSKADKERAFQVKEAGERLKFLEDPDHVDPSVNQKVQYSVATMEFAKGTQLNDLPLAERLALVKGEGFAQTMGRSMAPLMAMGMNDHIGGGNNSFATNPTNFLYDPKSGQLSVIDYSSNQEINGMDFDNPRIGQRSAGKGLKEVADVMTEGFKDQESFDEALYQMTDTSNGLTREQNALTRTMKPFLTAGHNSLFKPEENPETKIGTRVSEKSGKILDVKGGPIDLAISQEDRERFAVNMMAGMLDGIEYMQKNEQAFRNAVKNTAEVINGQKVEHIHSEQELDDFCKELQSIDVNKLKYNLGERVKGMEQRVDVKLAQLGNDAKEITDRMYKVQKNIDRIENHPSFADKMKKFATGKGEHPLDKYKAELTQLQKDGAKIQQESEALINKKGFNNELKNQADHPHTQQTQTQKQTTGHKVREDIAVDEKKQGLSQKKNVEVGVGDTGPTVSDNATKGPQQHVPTRAKLLTGTHKLEKSDAVTTQHVHGPK